MSGDECVQAGTDVELDSEALGIVRAATIHLYDTGRSDLFCDMMVTLCRRGFKYDPAFVVCVLVGAELFGNVPHQSLKGLYCANTSLCPEVWMKRYSLGDVCERVKDEVRPDRSVLPDRGGDWDELLCAVIDSPQDEELARALFPPRNKADLGVRNVRLADLLCFYKCNPQYGDVCDILRKLKFFDYIVMCNLLLAKVCFHGTLWWDVVCAAGLLEAGSEHFKAAAKRLSDLVKKERVDVSADLRVSLYEVASLYGAMSPPIPDWDPIEETRELAQSGQTAHGLYHEGEYNQQGVLDSIRELANVAGPTPAKPLSFREWLESATWERSGSSSVGKISFELEDEGTTVRGFFKARKNLILDVMSPEEIVALVMSTRTQENNAIIKPELGKARIAVSSPLGIYMGQSWMFDTAGAFYKNWPGNTLEETASQEAFRAESTYVRLRSGAFALPYDFSRFDHQPRLSEVLCFQDVLVNKALQRVCDVDRTTMLRIAGLQRHGFLHATLQSPPGLGERQTFKVTGGLMSGLRSTSCVGSGWNLVLGNMGRKLINSFRSSGAGVKATIHVRGDDTQVVSDNYHDVLGIKLAYDALGAEANESKFTLRRGRSEFLRIETSDRARGYPCRTVPLVVQRRPWNARPIGPESVVSHVAKILATLSRRTPSPEHVLRFRDFYISRVMGLLGLDPRLRSIPVGAGGLGLDPWDGVWMVRSWRQVRTPPVQVKNRTVFREVQVARELRDHRLPADPEVCSAIAQSRLQEKIALDDVPQLGGIARRLNRAELRQREVIRAGVDTRGTAASFVDLGIILQRCENLKPRPGAYGQLFLSLQAQLSGICPLWGCCKRDTATLSLAAEVSRAGRVPLGRLLAKNAPHVWEKLRSAERKYGVRRGVAIDIITAGLSVAGAEAMHPLLPGLCRMVGMLGMEAATRNLRRPAPQASFYAFQEAARLAHTSLTKSLYCRTLLNH